MLIDSPRLTDADRAHWQAVSALDNIRHAMHGVDRLTRRAEAVVVEFAARGVGYCGVSWGKDSVVVADIVARVAPALPLVWVRLDLYDNPDCVLVRDAFLARYPGCLYDEVIAVAPPMDPDGYLPTGAREDGYREARRRWGAAHVTGVRAEESATRRKTVARNGEISAGSCRPIARWTGEHVFAYLSHHDLPVHPAYAMSCAGHLDRSRLRVASIGGRRGCGMGRREWELRYYPDAAALAGNAAH